jgi:hypothetical protein
VLPDQTTGPILHLLLQMGKEGVVYLINRDNMGHFQSNDCQGSNDQIVQTFVGSRRGSMARPHSGRTHCTLQGAWTTREREIT